jgi:hypothetical protein
MDAQQRTQSIARHTLYNLLSEDILSGGLCTGMCCNDVACNPDKGYMGQMLSAGPRFVRWDDFWLDDDEICVSGLGERAVAYSWTSRA